MELAPVWVGSDANGLNGITDSNGLKLFRVPTDFGVAIRGEQINVLYEEFWLSNDGKKFKTDAQRNLRTYIAKDIAAREEVKNDEDEVIATAHDAYNAFTNWNNQLGVTYIIPAINGALKAIPMEAKDGYIIHPQNIDV